MNKGLMAAANYDMRPYYPEMLHQYQPNSWSCFPTCAAILLGIPVQQVIDEIGHDGSEILWPQYNDCRKHKGFSFQEILDVFMRRGYGLILIEKDPVTLSDLSSKDYHYVSFPEGNNARFENYLFARGILLLQMPQGWSHVVVYCDGLIYDPDKEKPAKLFDRTAYLMMVKLIKSLKMT